MGVSKRSIAPLCDSKHTTHEQTTMTRSLCCCSRVLATAAAQRAVVFSTTTTSRRFLSSRPFQILGLQQVAIGCQDKKSLNALWYDVMGLQASANKVLPNENVNEDIVKLGLSGSPYEVELDLMVPIDPEKSPKVSSFLLLLFYDGLLSSYPPHHERKYRYTSHL